MMRRTIRNTILIFVLLLTALGGPELTSKPPSAGLALGPAVVEAQDPVPPAPVWGIADTHNHQFANLGFGGLMIWGDVFRWDDDIAKALPWSDFVPGRYGDVLDYRGHSREYDVAAPDLVYPNIPATCPPGTGTSGNPCRGFAIHGPGGLRDLLNIFMSGGLGHAVGGYPQFDGYPRWNTYTGQMMYYQWLKRAWEKGGLRLMVVFAVNNEALCSVLDRKAGVTCEDMPAIDRQIQAVKDLERFIDLQNDGQNDGDGWYRIAYSPQQARQIINDGKLAVVLGIETPTLFGCKVNSDCTDEYVLTEIKRYRDMGVRHIYPLHNADNGFGGTGLYQDIFGLNTRVINGAWFDITNDCDPRIDFHMDLLDSLQPGTDPIHDLLIQLLREVTGSNLIPPRPPAGANCNARGLQPLGTTLINGLMDEKMIIDVDHLSERTFNDVMTIAEARQYAGVISSHNAYVELGIPRGNSHSMRHESNMLPEELERIRALGGNASVIIHQPDRSTMRPYIRPGSTEPVVPYTCGGSSEAWIQAYLYVVDRMQGGAVGLATDLNGLAGVPTPRFGLEACNGDYPYLYFPPGGVTYSNDPGQGLTRMQVGDKVFDYNLDGFANIGLLPDFVEDVRSLGVSEADLAPLFRSAEAYIHMWEQVDPGLPDPPNNAPSAHAGGPYLALTGTTVTLQGSGSDPDGDPLSFSWDLDDNGVFETSGQSTSFYVGPQNRDIPVVVRACDSHASGTQAACTPSRTFVHVRTPGRLFAWGGNRNGQLGVSPSMVAECENGIRCSDYPVPIYGLVDVVDVAAGKEHSLALKSDGTVWGWGGVRGPTPVQIDGLSNVVAISAGDGHALALKSDGSVWAWGSNQSGQLGVGDTASRDAPIQVPVVGRVTAISAGDRFNLALLDNGDIVGWGNNQSYQLGNQCRPGGLCLSPVLTPGFGGPNIVGIAAGRNWSHALEKDGAVWVLGGWDYETGQVRWTPARVGGLTHSVAISAGTWDHLLSIESNGNVWGYGRNAWGQIDVNCVDNSGFCWPSASSALNSQAVSVAAGYGFSMYLSEAGRIRAWGLGTNGRLGGSGRLNGVVGIAAGYDHGLAIVRTTASVFHRGGLQGPTTFLLPGYCGGVSLSQCSYFELPEFITDPGMPPIRVTYTYQPTPSGGPADNLVVAGSAFTLAVRDRNGNPVTSFEEDPLYLRYVYSDADWQWAEVLDEATLDLYRWDAAAGQWQASRPCLYCEHIPLRNELTIAFHTFESPSEFVLLGWADTLPPEVTTSIEPEANAAGWNKTDTTVTITAVDNAGGSGVHTLTYSATGAQHIASTTLEGDTATITISAEGQTTLTYAAQDNAGNESTSTTLTLQLDKTAPTATAIATPAPNADGWNSGDVTVSFSGVDGLSGIAACDADVVLSSEGVGQSASGTCTDLAGNVSVPATVSGIKIDKTAPTASAIAAPPPNANGWNNGDVTVNFSGVDGLSGIAACDADVVLSSEGGGQSASGTCIDLAGNVSAPATASGVNIDKTAPTIAITAPEPYAVLPVGTLLAFGADDAVSGIENVSATLVNGTTTQPVSSGDAVTQAGVYSIIVQATDMAGNHASETRYVVVYDPSAGFVTGGGWIDSPSEAYTPDPTLAGKATFGFVSKYQKGATVPMGNTEFQFKVAGLDFHSTSYEWLVVNQAGTNAQFKGSGTINGAGSYKFMLWAGDGTPDTFRIRIWEELNDVETVVYDNGVEQPIGGGSIVIHK